MNRFIPFALALLAIAAACDANNSTGPFTGNVKGTVQDTLGDALVGVRVVVYPPSGDSTVLHTASDGSWHLNNIAIGIGNVQIESLPPDCDTQPTYQYDIASPQTTSTLNVQVYCTQRHQVVAGRSDLDAGAIDRRRVGRRNITRA